MINGYVIDKSELKHDPAHEGALDDSGRLRVLPYSFWEQFSQMEIAAFCVARGFYCIPTTELVAWLHERIAGRSAIEIGSGSGVLAEAVGIAATDSKMQDRPEIRMLYQASRQTPVPYGPNVKEMDAREAISYYKPEVVVAAWVTHKWNEREAWREGNAYGVDEGRIIGREGEYIHVGNRHVHRNKPILDAEHEEFEFPWLVSRAMNGAPNFIACWRKQ